MKKDINQNVSTKEIQNEKPGEIPVKNSQMTRQKFVELTAATAAAFTIVPRHLLGGKNYIAPSDKIKSTGILNLQLSSLKQSTLYTLSLCH